MKGKAVLVYYRKRVLQGKALRLIKATGLWLVATSEGIIEVAESYMVLIETLKNALKYWGCSFDDVKDNIEAEHDTDDNTIMADDGCIIYSNGVVRWGIVA